MSRETVIKCDICGAPKAVELAVKVGRETDAAGGTDSVYENIDLCQGHVLGMLNEVLEKLPYSERSTYMSLVKGRMKR